MERNNMSNLSEQIVQLIKENAKPIEIHSTITSAISERSMLYLGEKRKQVIAESFAGKDLVNESFKPVKRQPWTKKSINEAYRELKENQINTEEYEPEIDGGVQDQELLDEKGKKKKLSEKHIGFKNMENKIEDEGKSKESAAKIAASISFKKYGKGRTERAAHAGKPVTKVESVNEAAHFNSYEDAHDHLAKRGFYPDDVEKNHFFHRNSGKHVVVKKNKVGGGYGVYKGKDE